jgi:dCMP deaminase
MLINAGIQEIVHFGDYPDELASEIVKEAGLRVRRFMEG